MQFLQFTDFITTGRIRFIRIDIFFGEAEDPSDTPWPVLDEQENVFRGKVGVVLPNWTLGQRNMHKHPGSVHGKQIFFSGLFQIPISKEGQHERLLISVVFERFEAVQQVKRT